MICLMVNTSLGPADVDVEPTDTVRRLINLTVLRMDMDPRDAFELATSDGGVLPMDERLGAARDYYVLVATGSPV